MSKTHQSILQHLLATLLIFLVITPVSAQLPMGTWRIHNPFSTIDQIAASPKRVYALTENSIFSIDKDDYEMLYFNKSTGLSASTVLFITYVEPLNRLLIIYNDGHIDLMDDEDEVESIPDFYIAQISESKVANAVCIDGTTAYLAMPWGILSLNLRKREIGDTYRILAEMAEEVLSITFTEDSLYAATSNHVYVASRKHNMIDYAAWTEDTRFAGKSNIQQIEHFGSTMTMLSHNKLYRWSDSAWQLLSDTLSINNIQVADQHLYAFADDYTLRFDAQFAPTSVGLQHSAAGVAIEKNGNNIWYAGRGYGLIKHQLSTHAEETFMPNGPISRSGYKIYCGADRTYIVPGGYWVDRLNLPGLLMTYKDGYWHNFNTGFFAEALDGLVIRDFCDVISDPTDESHIYIATHDAGLIEMRNWEVYKLYTPENSLIEPAQPNLKLGYWWVDGLQLDNQGNLWMQNYCSGAGVKVLSPDGKWHSILNEATRGMAFSRNMLISKKYPNIKITSCHNCIFLGAFDDNGTPLDASDDIARKHTEFEDQDGTIVYLERIFCLTEDKTGKIWVGTKKGIITFPDPRTLIENNKCQRIKIARNDGTNLADFLLNDEQINCIAVDGTNRKWIGTQNSGLYLVEELEGNQLTTYHHFTTDNSPLPADCVYSVDITPQGEVIVGTPMGIASFQGDAAESKEDYSDVYAYPNPVKPDYDGEIAILGLIDGSVVKITDAAGNLVCQTRSRGSIASWDGKDANGRRVRTGVYYAQCNTADGKLHSLIKILIIR